MKVLITGSNGFIGSNMANFFIQRQDQVIGWDINRKENEGYKTSIVDLLHDNLQIILEKEKPNAIIHCAGCANVGMSLQNPLIDYAGNTTGLYRLLEAMRLAGLFSCKFLMLSSAAVYGQPKQLPIQEVEKQQPMSPYALHKKMAEDICMYYVTYHGLQCRVARIFSAYGPGLQKQIFWDMYKKINTTGRLEVFGTGNESRDFIYIDDLVQALDLVFKCDSSEVIFNVANGKEVTIREIAFEFGKQMGIQDIIFNGVVRQGDPCNWCADITKLKKIGYQQTIDVGTGIENYIRWCRVLLDK